MGVKVPNNYTAFLPIFYILLIFLVFILITKNPGAHPVRYGYFREYRNSEESSTKAPEVDVSGPEPDLGPEKETFVIDSIDLECETLMFEPENETLLAKNLRDSQFFENLVFQIDNSTDMCAKAEELFQFRQQPLSDEEADYPLAYGILAYKNLGQVLFMLSSFYHPQNEYCIGVGQNADTKFHDLLRDLTGCWPNVHFMTRPPMMWGSQEIINSVYNCLEFLSHLKTDWKYFQYLSGFDVPLKTNLEMVRIFKLLNGTANMDVVPAWAGRLRGKKVSNSPLPIFKSSLSVLVPREAANEMAKSLVPRHLLNFLENTSIADEHFWGTLLANQEQFPIPGSFSGNEWIRWKNEFAANSTLDWAELDSKYYISRHQIWQTSNGGKHRCHGHFKSLSCVYSVADLPFLFDSTELVAHKIYAETYPAAFFCALKEIEDRSHSTEALLIDTQFYENLPQVALSRGEPMNEVIGRIFRD